MVYKNKVKIKKVKFGKEVKIVQPVNLYECEIQDKTFIGPFVEIQRNVIIGKNCRIQSHSFICEKVEIRENCFVGHGVVFINDNFKKNKLIKDKKKLKKTIVGKNTLIGSNSTILPVKIGSNVFIGAGSVVINDLKSNYVYAGNPAKKIRKL